MDDVGIFQRYSREHYGLESAFMNIALETSSFCNRGCAFCPVGIDRKEVVRMKSETFLLVINQLRELRYRGDVCLNWYNEPLADSRIIGFVKMVRYYCPDSFIYFSSNGDLLTPQLFRRLVDAGLSMIAVSQYDGAVQPNVQAVLDDGCAPNKIHVQVKGSAELVNSRAGTVQSLYVLQEPLKERCIRPDEQMIINAQGDVPLCCNDYYVRERIGNVAETPLLELWNSPRFVEVRAALRNGDRDRIGICTRCNEPDSSYEKSLPRGVR